MKHRFWAPWLALLLTSCGGPGTYAEREQFAADMRYQRTFREEADVVCAAVRRVMMGEGYLVGEGKQLSLHGGKEFHDADRQHVLLHLYVSCAPRAAGSVLYATATEEEFDVKTIRQSSSIGFPLLAPIFFGKTTETDSPVKLSGETVQERGFYERFYQAVQRELGGPRKQ